MKRRAFLATCASLAAAGCTAPGRDPAPTTELSVEQAQSPDGVAIDVEIARWFDDQGPGKLIFTLSNVSKSEQTYEFGPTPPWSTYRGEHGEEDASLVLLPEDSDHVHVEGGQAIEHQGSDCWRIGGKLVQEDIAYERTLGPGEEFSRTYTMLAGRQSDPCLPAGDYRFDQQYYLNGQLWGFTIRVPSAIHG